MKEPITVTVTTVEIRNFVLEMVKAKKQFTWRGCAYHFMPPKYKWFENAEDFGLAIFLETLWRKHQETRKHYRATYTFGKQGAC